MGLVESPCEQVCASVCVCAWRDESTRPVLQVVAEAVVVMRQLLQKDPVLHKGVVKSMVKLLPSVTNPRARSAIVWIIGEYRDVRCLFAIVGRPSCVLLFIGLGQFASAVPCRRWRRWRRMFCASWLVTCVRRLCA